MNEQILYQKTNAKALRGPYLFVGEEELTKQEALDRIIASLDTACRDMNLHRLKNPDGKELLNSANQLPFFDLFHVVIVTEWSDAELFDSLSAEDKKQPGTIERFFSLSDAVVLFVRRGDPKENSFTKLFSARDRLVRFAALTPDRAAKFCMREAAMRNVSIDDRTARTLIEMVGTDAYRLRNELSKASGYVGSGGRIDAQVLDAVVTASTEYNAFRMLDALLAGDKKTAVRMLETVLRSGKESAMGIAGFLEGRIRLILIARELQDQKKNRKEILSAIGGNPYAAESALKSAQKYSADVLKNAVSRFAEVNALVKAGVCDEKAALFQAVYRSF